MSEFVTLGDCITIQKGKAPLETGYSGAGAKLYLNPEYLRGRATAELARPKSDSVHARDGDTILLWDGSNAGEFFKAKTGLVASTMAKVIPNVNFNSSYFLHVVKHVEIFLRGQTNGTGIPHVDREILEAIRVFCPMSAEQKCLAEILDHLDTTIHETEAIIAKLKAVKQGLLHDLLTRGIDGNGELRPPQSEAPHLYKDSSQGWIPKEWAVASVGSLLSEPPRNGLYKPPHLIGRGTLLVGQTAFTGDGSLNFELARRAQIGKVEISAFALRAGDLLVSRVFATLDGVGQPVIVPELLENAVYESNMMRLRAIAGVMTSTILFNLLKKSSVRAAVRSCAFLSNQASINRQGICSIEVPLPLWAEQLAIDARVKTVVDQLNYEAAVLSKSRALRAGLMDDLLTGRVRVTPLLEGNAP